MVAASRALAHAKKVMDKKEYAAFNPADFSLPNVFTKEERITAELVFNYTSQLEPTESGEIPAREQAEPSVGTGTNPPPNSPARDQSDPPRADKGKQPAEEMPPPPDFEIPVPVVQPPFLGLSSSRGRCSKQCTTIRNLPDEEKPGFEPKSPLDPAQFEETPFELIEDQPEWRQQYLRNVDTFNGTTMRQRISESSPSSILDRFGEMNGPGTIQICYKNTSTGRSSLPNICTSRIRRQRG